jgi:hypothetical protein
MQLKLLFGIAHCFYLPNEQTKYIRALGTTLQARICARLKAEVKYLCTFG